MTNTCIICNSLFQKKPNTSGLYCSLPCSNTDRKRKNSIKYMETTERKCINCNTILSYESRKYDSKFCSHSCSASFTNKHRERSKNRKPSTLKGITTKKYSKVKPCTICNKVHGGNGATCSKTCKRESQSRTMKKLVEEGFNPQLNRGRNKRSYLETSFENWLISLNITSYLAEVPFKNHIKNITYFADFYFPHLNLIVELDGSQHGTTNAKQYDLERDNYILQKYSTTTIRISHKEYVKGSRKDEVLSYLL